MPVDSIAGQRCASVSALFVLCSCNGGRSDKLALRLGRMTRPWPKSTLPPCNERSERLDIAPEEEKDEDVKVLVVQLIQRLAARVRFRRAVRDCRAIAPNIGCL